MPFQTYLIAMNVVLCLAYNLDVHNHLSKPHVIQAIIRTWKSAEPTPENNATPAECVYLKVRSWSGCVVQLILSPFALQVSGSSSDVNALHHKANIYLTIPTGC